MQQSHPPPAATTTPTGPPESGDSTAEAPPKQVALAMDRLSSAGRLIADIRLGADRLLEALFVVAAAARPHSQSDKPLRLILKEEASMRQHLQDLRTVGRQLEASGVLNGSLRSRGNSWGLHMPLVCPDGAVVAYAWKRQLAGQAGASAVDRTRLALKAFTDQKRRFFPHLEDESFGQACGGEFGALKKHRSSQASTISRRDEISEDKTLSDVLIHLEKEAPNMRVFTYQRLDWLKRASSLSSSGNDNVIDLSKEQIYHGSNRLRTGSLGAVAADQVAVVELLVPSVFRAIVSLHPAGSINPDAVAFFSPDEEHANKALQYFVGAKADSSLDLFLQWISSYETLFTKPCSKCRRLLMMDKPTALFLPPVHRPYQQTSTSKISSTQQPLPQKDQSSDVATVYHIGCSSDET
ncbi:mediator of RNA polymerase II transcription subunit 27 isoform X2 [Magnolia sinica]|uniref:mediator of RNA polymerase II transcription subunit 27 isoform X2 n=1 Tax=Magnolia sinica TaxID=86752 RepID=UPI00265AB160|nr:mediator of RNA polymerase II transcription subunit 27 isoform X2 [Magnolia sinica]